MAKHTPGPWRVMPDSLGTIETVTGTIAVGQTFDIVSPLVDGKHEERMANARLIAAAPRLLDALEKILAHAESTDIERMQPYQCTLCHTYRMIGHAAIAAAKGLDRPPFLAALDFLLCGEPVAGRDGTWIPSVLPADGQDPAQVKAWLESPHGTGVKRSNPSAYANVCAYLIAAERQAKGEE